MENYINEVIKEAVSIAEKYMCNNCEGVIKCGENGPGSECNTLNKMKTEMSESLRLIMEKGGCI